MNKIFIATLLAFLLSSLSCAQTHYYRLTKKIVNGMPYTKVSGGQFITFIADICYESNKKGIGVGHGTLQRNSNFSNSQFKVYMGKSYWGSDATFKFTSDLATLNVVTESGDVYLYKRATPPANVTTCSLIRKSSSSGGGSGGGVYPVQPINSGGGGSIGGSSVGSGGRSSSSGHRCNLCNGTGRKVRESWSGDKTSTKWCNECNRNVGMGHSHTKCDLCGGDGWCD